jgi:hypothetical protein
VLAYPASGHTRCPRPDQQTKNIETRFLRERGKADEDRRPFHVSTFFGDIEFGRPLISHISEKFELTSVVFTVDAH